MSQMLTLNELAEKIGSVAQEMFFNRHDQPTWSFEIGGDEKVLRKALDKIMKQLWKNFKNQPWDWQLEYKKNNKWELSLVEADSEPEWPDFDISFSEEEGSQKMATSFTSEDWPEEDYPEKAE